MGADFRNVSGRLTMSNQGRGQRVPNEPLAVLRAGDHDRFVQVLLARSADRPPLLALFLFNLELARIPDAVREPMAGLIRLQWWRDALADPANGSAHPVLATLAESGLRDRIDPARLEALVDARARELDAAPIGRVAELEAYAERTAGALNAAAASVIGAPPAVVERAERVGTAYGMLGILRALPFVLHRPVGAFSEAVPAELEPLVRAVASRADDLVKGAGPLRGRRHAPVLVLGLLARQDARRLARAGYDVFDGRLAERPPWTVARCLFAASVGRY
jgi:phytoene/squalene synthetase